MSLALGRTGPRQMAQPLLVGLAASVALHLALAGLFVSFDSAPAALVSAGDTGDELVSLEALQAAFVELEPEMPQLPPPQMALPLTAPVIEFPQVVLPDPVLLPPEPPRIKIDREPPPPELQPRPAKEPPAPRRVEKPRPKEPGAAPVVQQSPARAAQRAAGAGGTAQAGQGGKAEAAVVSAGTAKNLLGQWGAGIRSRVERRKAYPSAAGRASGTATVQLTVARGGELLGVSLARSSGNAALDQAALSAVRKAGTFAPAPAGLTKASYGFSLKIKFSR